MMDATKIRALLGAAAFIIPFTSAWAQSSPDADANEIVVSAQKRSQNMRDVPLSITAVGGDDLKRNQANDVSSITNLSTNVVATTSAGLPAFTVRGIGLNVFAANFDAPVAVHIDEVYRSKPYMNMMPFYDIDRVEVLKGPQGTLFGRNTTGGAVNFYTVQPTNEVGGQMSISGDNFQRYRVEGAVNSPLGQHLAARLSYYIAQGNGGPYYNLYSGSRYGSPNVYAGRLQLKYQHDDTLVRLAVAGYRDRSEGMPYKSPGIFNPDGSFCAPLLQGVIDKNKAACLRFGSGIPGPDPSALRETQSIREINADYLWMVENNSVDTNLRIEQKIGSATLTSITAYTAFERYQGEDADNTPYVTANDDYYSLLHQLTQELRLSGEVGSLTYLAGGYYEKDTIHEVDSADVSANPLLPLPPTSPRVGNNFRQTTRSLAAFTNLEYRVTPTISLIGGLRYTNDKISLDGTTFLGGKISRGTSRTVNQVVPVDAANTSRTDSNLSFRAGVNWHITPMQMVYTSISRGFRSGGFSVPFGGVITTFAPERLTSYEVGYKGSFFDKTLDFNSAFFWYDYQKLQVNAADPVSPLTPITRNIGASRSYGVDADLTWRATPTWSFRAGVGFLDAKFTNTDRVIATYNGIIPLNGKRPVNTPKWTAQGAVQKIVPLSSDLELRLRTDGRYTAARYLVPTGQIFDRAAPYWIQNVRVSVGAPDGSWEIAAFGKNIWDSQYLTYLNNNSFQRVEIWGDPASYGLQASFRF